MRPSDELRVREMRREPWHDEIIESFRLPDGTFPLWRHTPPLYEGGPWLGTVHGEQYMPPWVNRHGEYVVDDFGNLVGYLPTRWPAIDAERT